MRLLLALWLLVPVAALAEDRPPAAPTRDVDVTYLLVQPDAKGGPRVLEERMRWAAAEGRLRVDPPTPGMWVLMDSRAHRVSTVREHERSVVEVESEATLPGPGAAPGAGFIRQGADTVAGVTCTNWLTRDVSGTPTLACITADGVLLRATAGGRVLVEALSVRYGPIDPEAFRVPEDFRRIAPPPLKR